MKVLRLHAVEELPVLLPSRLQKLSSDLWPRLLLKRNVDNVSSAPATIKLYFIFLLFMEFYLQHPVTLPFEEAAVTENRKKSTVNMGLLLCLDGINLLHPVTMTTHLQCL